MEKIKNSGWALFSILLGAALLGLSAVFVRWSETSPSVTAFYRALFAIPFLLYWVYFTQDKFIINFNKAKGLWFLFILAGISFGIDMALWNWSIHFTSVAHATLMANTAPIFVTLISIFYLRNNIHSLFLLALLLSVIGVLIVIGAGSGSDTTRLLGDSLGILAALFYAGYILSVKQLTNNIHPAYVLLVTTFVTAVFLFPVSLIEAGNFFTSSISSWGVLLSYAVVSQVIAQGLITFGISRLSVHLSALTLLVQPIAAALFGMVLLGENINSLQVFGGFLVLVGIYLAASIES